MFASCFFSCFVEVLEVFLGGFGGVSGFGGWFGLLIWFLGMSGLLSRRNYIFGKALNQRLLLFFFAHLSPWVVRFVKSAAECFEGAMGGVRSYSFMLKPYKSLSDQFPLRYSLYLVFFVFQGL